jgi:hypothetical protein
MNDQTYRTPEGFDLWKSLVFPDVRVFTDLFMIDGAWDFATMNHLNGIAGPERPADITRPGYERVVGRFCSVQHMDRPHLVVTPSDEVLDYLFSDACGFWSHISFEAIYHESTDRVLVTAGDSAFISTRWLGYVTPESVPSP